MKKLFFSALLLVGMAATSQAQVSYRVTPPGSFLSWTNLAQSATNVAYVLDVRGSQYVSVYLSLTNDAAGTDNSTYVFYRSMDGTTATKEDAAVAAIALAETGTTAKNVITNIPTFGCGYLILGYTTNAAATANCITRMKYSLKNGI